MENIGSVSILLKQLPRGEKEVQNALLNRYRSQVVEYARYRLLQSGVRSKEADDIAQEVFIALFRRTESGQLLDVQDRDVLWMKLRQIANDRVKDARKKRLPFTESAIQSSHDSSAPAGLPQVPHEELDECLVGVEQALMQMKLAERHPDLPEIANLKMQGYSVQEIADRLSLPKRTIERRLAWINQICEEYATP